MQAKIDLELRLRELRQNFDQGFAAPALGADAPREDLLAIRVGSDPYVLRSSDIGAIAADRPLTRLPSDSPALLGIVGVRANVVAVFDLATLLGLPRADNARWIALARGSSAAFAFAAFEGQLRLPRELIAYAEAGAHPALRFVARSGGGSRPLIELPVLTARLQEAARAAGSLGIGG
jgi:chemotaxis signal transduction protein